MSEIKKYRTYNVWDKNCMLRLPGTTTVVTIDFDKLTKRMRTNLRKQFDAYKKCDRHRSYYSKSSQLLDKLLDYYEVPRATIEEQQITLDGINEKLWDKAYELALANVTTYLMNDERWKQHARNDFKNMTDAYGEAKTRFVWWARGEKFSKELLEDLRQDYAQYQEETFGSRLEKVEHVVNFGGVIHFELT